MFALKTIRSEIGQNERAMERFRREIQTARKVTHPNVCRIFYLFHHRTDQCDVTFLTMELLRGETLRDRLIRCGKMTTTEALPLVLQMADALGAAHRAGIVQKVDLLAAKLPR